MYGITGRVRASLHGRNCSLNTKRILSSSESRLDYTFQSFWQSGVAMKLGSSHWNVNHFQILPGQCFPDLAPLGACGIRRQAQGIAEPQDDRCQGP